LDRITGTAIKSVGAWDFLAQLTDSIGGRVTGTRELAAAQELISKTLRSAGLDNVRVEEWRLENRWRRGRIDARLESPVQERLAVGAWGWSPGTPGRITTRLLDLGVVRAVPLTLPPDVRGATVMLDPAATAADTAFVIRTLAARQLASAGAAALLISSDKPGRMLYTSGFGNYPRAALPMLSIGKEDALFVRRLLGKAPVTVSLAMTNVFEPGPFDEPNVLADLRGGTAPQEMVLVGAHVDSWDPAQGALDNGAGVAALVDAARILRSLNVRPKRTIRFAFWSGEEQAILGSRFYVENHRDELARLRAVVNFDHGPQDPRGFLLQGRTDLVPTARRLLAPLAAFGVTDFSESGSFDTDHAFFAAAGVPTFDLAVDPGDYDLHHHAVTDTLDKVDRRLLALNTAVIAAAAWILADTDEPLAHLSGSDATRVMERLGVLSAYRLLLGQ
jgi:Iap family predicted aminopeptidase